jgi:hypothetical protein
LTTSNPIYFGARTPADNFLEGKIYSVRLFNRALSQSEIITLYNNGLTGQNALPIADIGANNTPYYQSNFSSTVDSWTLISLDEISTLTFDTDHMVLEVSTAGTSTAYPRVKRIVFL